MAMIRQSKAAYRVRFVVADGHRLTADALGRQLREILNWELAGTSSTQEEAVALVRDLHPDLIIASPFIAEPDVMRLCRALQAAWPPIGILILDDDVRISHVREALRANVAGYHTKFEPFENIASAAQRIVVGQRSYCHDVATKLVDTPQGPRLRPHFRFAAMEKLTSRELDVLTCVARGESVKTCAESLGIKPSTVENHKSRLMAKLGVRRNVDLVRVALQEKLIPDRPSPPQLVEESAPVASD